MKNLSTIERIDNIEKYLEKTLEELIKLSEKEKSDREFIKVLAENQRYIIKKVNELTIAVNKICEINGIVKKERPVNIGLLEFNNKETT